MKFKCSFNNIKKDNQQNGPQFSLLDLVNMIDGPRYLQLEWKNIIGNLLYTKFNIEESDEAIVEEANEGTGTDIFDLINHDGRYTFYAHTDLAERGYDSKPITKAEADQVINYVHHHLAKIKDHINRMDDDFYKIGE